MSLISMLYNAPLYQPNNLPPKRSSIIVLCSSDDIQYIPTEFQEYNVKLIITDKFQDELIELDNCTIQINSDLTSIFNYKYCYIVFFSTETNISLLHHFHSQLNTLMIGHIYICMPISRSLPEPPNFFDTHQNKLEKVFSLLDDDESRNIFVSKIKTIMLADIGYLRRSKYAQYLHPKTLLQKGDIVIDGGVSGNVSVEQKFSELVGDEGHIYSFEPEPVCYFQAEEQIKNIKNITLLPFGLSNKIEKVFFTSIGPGSHVTDTPTDNTVTCHMTTIDTIIAQYNIKKVDIIKLDVEGSEEKSLLGSIKTIVKHRPKLMISLYHKFNDIFELPLLINELDLNYSFYMGHHSSIQWETVLYAVPN